MEKRNFSAKVIECNKELTAKERVALTTMNGAIPLDEATQMGDLDITPVTWAAVAVHNEKAENKDYTKYVVIDTDGTVYATGSKSFWESFIDIADQMEGSGEEWGVRVTRRNSNNYAGRQFLTCSVI